MEWKKTMILAVVVIVFIMSVAFTITTLTNANLLPIEIIANMGKWNGDTLTVRGLDTIVFVTDTLQWRQTNYRNTTGQVILRNVDATDTLIFALQATPTKWIEVDPEGGWVRMVPAFMETLYVDLYGSGMVDLQYLFTLVGIENK